MTKHDCNWCNPYVTGILSSRGYTNKWHIYGLLMLFYVGVTGVTPIFLYNIHTIYRGEYRHTREGAREHASGPRKENTVTSVTPVTPPSFAGRLIEKT